MANVRFEKFEMKYGCFLPEDFKKFMNNYGGDALFGSCRFEYGENIVNNLLRIPGEMDFHLIPFGDVGNGDYYCFYKYGPECDEYYVGIWLHETQNFVILNSSFQGFLYKCALDDYFSTLLPNEDLNDNEDPTFLKECFDRCKALSEEYGFNFDKIRTLKDEFDYHKFMVDYDSNAIQSLCFLGIHYLKQKDKIGVDYLDQARNIYKPYVAPNYLLGKALYSMDKDGGGFFMEALRGSLVLTGYSYWEEDYLEIPEDVHREIALMVDERLGSVEEEFERKLYQGADPYDFELRLELARHYQRNHDSQMAVIEYNNALFCCENKFYKKDILNEALISARENGQMFLTGIIEQDIRKLR